MSRIRLVPGMALACAVWIGSFPVWGAEETFKIDPTHSFVTFSIPHLGYSLLQGRFDTIEGGFSLDIDKPEGAAIQVTVATPSVNSNHAERDKHLRGKDFLDVERFPKATFQSRRIVQDGGRITVEGDLTLHGVTKAVGFEARSIGGGPDPWGGFRRGYAGT
ncbi:MAG: YceI family protein, partial [Magnetococcales bacterium]|nr:YceI family protein [Magnetococcales bacterium]